MDSSVAFLGMVLCTVSLFFIGLLCYYQHPKISMFAGGSSMLMGFIVLGQLFLRGF